MTLTTGITRPKVDPAEIMRLADAAVAARRGWSGPIGMSMGPDPDPNDDGGAGGGGGNDPDPDATVTIDGREWKIGDLQRLAADEKRQGKRAGERDTLAALGVESVDDAKALIAAAKQRQKDEETEAQTKAREAAEARAAADREKADAAAERRQASVERALIRAGVNEDDLDDAVVLLEKGLDKDADADAIKDAADKLKERREELFTSTGTKPPGRPAAPTPSGRPGPRNTPQDKPFGAGGLARAEKRFGKAATGA